MNEFDKSVLSAIEPLCQAGFAIHWLHPKTKRPIGDDWSNRPVASAETLRRRHQPGNNVGVRLGEPSRVGGGYLHVIDLDVRDPACAGDAQKKLDEVFPGIVDSVPSVISGSGGASRHYYFVTERPFTSKKLARSEEFVTSDDGVRHRLWEIELFGTGKQVVLPPSIHPHTGQPYRWEKPFEFDTMSIGLVPEIRADHLETLTIADNRAVVGERKPPLGLSDCEIRDILAELPPESWDDRDPWLNRGMAIHHETGGSDVGYDLWTESSRQSAKFNERAQRYTWKNFDEKPNPVTMASVIAERNQVRSNALLDRFDEVEDDVSTTDIDNLIGGTSVPNEFDATINSARSNWRSFLHLNDKGETKSTLHNIRLMVENDERTRGLVAFNEFTQEVVQRGTPGIKPPVRQNAAKPSLQLTGPNWKLRDPVNGDFWTEDKDNAIRAVFEAPETQGGFGIKIPDRDLKAAIDIVGRKNPFHPVREYLHRLKWDGVPRIEHLFQRFLGAPDDAYHRSVGRLMLVAAVTRVHEPAHKWDTAVILEGLQGKRKSTFISTLARGWFVELDGDITDTQQMVELLQGAWLVELNELGGFAKADVRHIKAFISRQSDKVRLAYAKRAQEYHRQSIFVGSTNDDVYLKDQTGGRRFLPVKCTVDQIDTESLDRETDQLWAEALHVYREMRAAQPKGLLPLYLTDAEAHAIAERLQESRQVESSEDAITGRIAEWLSQPINDGGFDDVDAADTPRYRERVCLLEIWVECLGRDEAQYVGGWPSTLGRAMRMVPDWRESGKRDRFPKFGQQRSFVREGRIDRLLDGTADLIG